MTEKVKDSQKTESSLRKNIHQENDWLCICGQLFKTKKDYVKHREKEHDVYYDF